MKPGQSTIDQIFSGTRVFNIPFYQRSYVWDVDQWKRLLSDMIAVGRQTKDYFLGAIILKQESTGMAMGGDCKTVIDGQQRLTTLAIFLKVLYLKTNANAWFNRKFILPDDSLAIKHSYVDRDDFEKVIRQDNYTGHLEGSSNIIKAYNYFCDNLNPEDLNIPRIKDHVQVIDIIIDDKDDEQQIFDTINSLGVDLTTAELLKNHLFSEETLAEYNKYWKPAFENDDECIDFWKKQLLKGRTQQKNIEAFLNAFLQIKVHEAGREISAEDKAEYARASALFASYKKFISCYYAGNEFEFVKELTEYAGIFRRTFNPDITEHNLTYDPGLDRINFLIYAVDGTTMMPFVMYVIKNVPEEVDRKAIFDYLEAYIVRRMICKKSSKNYSDLFSENLINAGVRSAQQFIDYINEKDETNALAMPNNKEVLNAFLNTEQPNYRGLSILYLLESRMRNSLLLSTQLLKYSSYTLEHLMPIKWFSKWPLPEGASEIDRIHKIKTLGNFTIITQSLNSTVGNESWSIKLVGKNGKGGLKDYAKDLLTMEGVLEAPSWSEQTINERAFRLASKATKIWTSRLTKDFNIEDIIISDEGEITLDQETGERHVISRDHTRYSLDGATFMGKCKFVPFFIRSYIEKHPGLTYQQIKEIFPDSLMESGYKFLGLICPVSAFEQWDNQYKFDRYRADLPERKLVSVDNIEFYVNTQWTLPSVQNILRIAQEDGWVITIQE